jgi:hypothetical protein
MQGAQPGHSGLSLASVCERACRECGVSVGACGGFVSRKEGGRE